MKFFEILLMFEEVVGIRMYEIKKENVLKIFEKK